MRLLKMYIDGRSRSEPDEQETDDGVCILLFPIALAEYPLFRNKTLPCLTMLQHSCCHTDGANLNNK